MGIMSNLNTSHIRRVRRIRLKWEKDPERDNGKWTIIKEMIIQKMALFPSFEIKSDVPLEKIIGLWFELTDDENKLLYRGKILDPRLNEVELFDEEGYIYRQKAEREEFIFDILLPDLPKASLFKLYRTFPTFKEEVKKISRHELQTIAILKMLPTIELLRRDQ